MNFSTLFRTKENLSLDKNTLTILRYIAIFGQFLAIGTVYYYLKLPFPILESYLIISLGLATNLYLQFGVKINQLKDFYAAPFLLYDLIQLSALLYLTGGIFNPFSFLLIIPAIVSSTFLSMGTTIILGVITSILLLTISFFYLPLPGEEMNLLHFPNFYKIGIIISILIGLIFLSYFGIRFAGEKKKTEEAFKKLQEVIYKEYELESLGGQAAAAAHSLGTPLATIKLASSELMDELKDKKELWEDAVLIRDQADRCRDILQSMGQAGKDDQHMRNAPVSEVIREAAEPHSDRGKEIIFELNLKSKEDISQPLIQRRPEIIHGLRNMIQNAIDFANNKVWIVLSWSETDIKITINDDGPGFPLQMISRIGDPFVSYRKASSPRLKQIDYQGMGLGLFIAKTLLERTNAKLSFSNGGAKEIENSKNVTQIGAIVEIVWLRSDIEAQNNFLGENENLQVF